MDFFPIQKYCKQPCLHTRTTSLVKNEKGISGTVLQFNEDVVFTKKMTTYGYFEFIIDIGSSLGLWLGLSVFGLTDLFIELTDKIRKIFDKTFKYLL